jgi:hypothetical protein
MGDKANVINGNIVVGAANSIGFGISSDPQVLEATGPQIVAVNGDPNGSLVAPVGTLALDENGPTLWQNTDGISTWTAAGGGGGSTVLTGGADPNGVVTGVRGQLYVGTQALLGNPAVYQNNDLVSGTTWRLIASSGPADIGSGIVGSKTYTPTGASTNVAFNGALVGDLAFVTIQTDDTGTSLGAVLSATVTADQVAVTTANGAGLNNDGVVAILLIRP